MLTLRINDTHLRRPINSVGIYVADRHWCIPQATINKPDTASFIIRRVTWGKAPPFGDDLSLTYLFASTSEKSYMYVTNYYVMYIKIDRISHAQ